jgi:glycosyltransferase involved in cell wall biosynthesis
MKVAIVHDWLTGMRGGEKCLEVFCELYPDADIHTLLHLKGTVSPVIEAHRIRPSFVQRLPLAQRRYRYYLPIFPLAAGLFEFDGHDLILSSSHCVAKNVRVPSGVCHISYVHTPMRYVWDQYDAYFGPGRAAWSVRSAMRLVRPWLQRQDVLTSRSVHYFIANSRHVAARIRAYYDRDASVIHPPVDVEAFAMSTRDDGYYLMVTALVPYKRVDLAIEAFNRLKLHLRIIGSGQDEKRLRELAGPTVKLLGWRSDVEVREAYAGCRALIFPGEEDFGIVPVEAMASGKPVIAYAKGGALETVVALDRQTCQGMQSELRSTAPTGVFFREQTPHSLIEAVRRFETERNRFDPGQIRAHAESFNRQRFKDDMRRFVLEKHAEFQAARKPHSSCPRREPRNRVRDRRHFPRNIGS